jgi:hypothetical protein
LIVHFVAHYEKFSYLKKVGDTGLLF